MSGIVEKVVVLGAPKALVGIVSGPAQAPAEPRPALIILNSGIIHRVGNHRMFVTFARRMAAAGYVVLRFDLSGLGDSQERVEVIDPLVGNLGDIADAVDWTIDRGAPGVILMGLCSGADHSVVYASRDPRVIGVVLLDPSIPPTPRFVLISIRRRLARLVARLGVLAIPKKLWLKTKAAMAVGQNAPGKVRPPSIQIERKEVRGFIEDAYRKVVGNRARILALFTGGFEHQHNYREQIIEAFPKIRFGDQLRVDYLAEVDHTFTLEKHRDALFAAVHDWIGSTPFPLRPAASSAAKVV